MRDILKLLLVIPVAGRHQYVSFGVGYIASYIKKYGDKRIQLKLADENAGENVLKKVKEIKPDIIGITASTPQIQRAGEIAEGVKEINKQALVVIGGIHVTTMPGYSLSNFPSVDIEVIGEGEETMREICDLWLENKGKFFDQLDLIDGITFRRKGEIVTAKERKLVLSLDKIPPPDREIFDEKYYFSPRQLIRGFSARRSTSVLTSRGCPYQCKFCASNLMAQKYRAHSVSYILKEVKNLIEKYKIKAVYFHDDLFLADKKRVLGFCEAMIRAGYNKKVIWCCQTRAELINESARSLLQKMKEAGCRQLEFGFESGSNRVLKFLKGETASVEKNQRAIEIVFESGLQVFGNFMIGSITETKEEIELTKKFVEKNLDKINFFQTYLTVPYPGTMMWKMCKKAGLVKDDERFENYFLFNGDNVLRSFSDTVSKDFLEKKVMELNSLALKKISGKEKIAWLIKFLFKDPRLVFKRAKTYLKGF